MKIAVLSGKGGTGKTFVSVNLAAAAGRAVYTDCDIEEPDGHLFFRPEKISEEKVAVSIPSADNSRCSGCRKCTEFCRFNALALIRDNIYIFEDICHSCGGCVLLCPEKALTEVRKEIGIIRRGRSEETEIRTGILNTGEASGVPVIRQLITSLKDAGDIPVIIDCPPGSSCTVMESIKDADYCILIAEPTIFGRYNLDMAYRLVRSFGKPTGVVLNKYTSGRDPSEDFCRENDVNILASIPFDRDLGRLISEGRIAVKEDKKWEEVFSSLLRTVSKEADR